LLAAFLPVVAAGRLARTHRRHQKAPHPLGVPPETFVLDGRQHMLFSAGGGLYLFVRH
jgi:hypothetical protein